MIKIVKTLKKSISLVLSSIICISSMMIGGSVETSAVNTEVVPVSANSNSSDDYIQVSWRDSDGTWSFLKNNSTSSFLNLDYDGTNSIYSALSIEYKIQKVRDEGYEPGELQITLNSVGNILHSGIFVGSSNDSSKAIEISADKESSTTKTHNWSYSWDADTDTYVFTNNKAIAGGTVLDGIFELKYQHYLYNCKDGYTNNNISASMDLGDGNSIKSDPIKIAVKTYRNEYVYNISMEGVSSISSILDSLDYKSEYVGVAFSTYEYVVRKSRSVKKDEGYYIEVKDCDDAILVYCPTAKKVSSNVYYIDTDCGSPTVKTCVIFAIPKSYLGKKVTFRLYEQKSYYDEDSKINIFDVEKTFYPDDFDNVNPKGNFFTADKISSSLDPYTSSETRLSYKDLISSKGQISSYNLNMQLLTTQHIYSNRYFYLYNNKRVSSGKAIETHKMAKNDDFSLSFSIPRYFNGTASIEPYGYYLKVYASENQRVLVVSVDEKEEEGLKNATEENISLLDTSKIEYDGTPYTENGGYVLIKGNLARYYKIFSTVDKIDIDIIAKSNVDEKVFPEFCISEKDGEYYYCDFCHSDFGQLSEDDVTLSDLFLDSTDKYYTEGKYNIDICDDVQQVLTKNGKYRTLRPDEYSLTRVSLAGDLALAGSYKANVYIAKNGEAVVPDDAHLYKETICSSLTEHISLPEGTTAVLVRVFDFAEANKGITIKVDTKYTFGGDNSKDISMSGEVLNFGSYKIYVKAHNLKKEDSITSENNVEYIWIDALSKTPLSSAGGGEIEIYQPEETIFDKGEYYPYRKSCRKPIIPIDDRDTYSGSISITPIEKKVGNCCENSVTLVGNITKGNKSSDLGSFSLYSILPEGVNIKDVSSADDLYDIAVMTAKTEGSVISSDACKSHCTVEYIEDYKGSGRIYVAFHFNDFAVKEGYNYIYVTIPLVTDLTIVDDSKSINLNSFVMLDTDDYIVNTVHRKDDGKHLKDNNLSYDIDNDGNVDELVYISRSSYSVSGLRDWQYSLSKLVKTPYTGTYVSNGAEVGYGEKYSYRVTLNNGSAEGNHFVFKDVLESENSEWKGTFESIILPKGINGVIYYSSKDTPNNDIHSSDWSVEKPSVVKAVAIDFGDYILNAYKSISIVINMIAPDNKNLKNTLAYNKASISLINDYGETFNDETNAVSVKLIPVGRNIQITKVDAISGVKLSGAVFDLVDANTDIVLGTKTTNTSGSLTFKNISSEGSYYLVEKEAPVGYKLNTEKIPVDISSSAFSKVIKNERKKGIVDVVKQNNINSKIVVGNAEYTIYSDDGNELSKAVTNEKGMAEFDNLEWGKYVVKETKAPEGYEIDTVEYPVTVDKNSVMDKIKIVSTDVQSKECKVTVTKYEELDDGTKTDVALNDCMFKLYLLLGEEEIPMGNYKTNREGKFFVSELPYGSYVLKEYKAKKGYNLCKDVKFELSSENPKIDLTVYDTRKKGSIILKNTINKPDVTGACEFTLYDSNTDEPISSLVTDENDEIVFEEISWGDYYIRETKVPDYLVLGEEKYDVSITSSQLIVNVEAITRVKYGEVLIRKTDELGIKKLKDAVFNLYTSEGVLVRKGLTTNAEGEIYVSGLDWYRYYLEETKAPNGYSVSKDKIQFTINENTVGSLYELVVTNPESTDANSKTIKIIKTIKASDINFANGNPTFLYEAHTDGDIYGNPHTYHRLISFDENYVQANTDIDGNVSQEVTISGISSGIYSVGELDTMRYSITSVVGVDNCEVSSDGKSGIVDVSSNKEGTVEFISDKYEFCDFSDDKTVANVLSARKKYIALKAVWSGDSKLEMGKPLNTDDLVIRVIYDDGSTKDLTKDEYSLDRDIVPTIDGVYTITATYVENGVSHSAVFNINVKKQIVKVKSLKVEPVGALAEDNLVGQGDVISPLEFKVSVTQIDGTETILSPGTLVPKEEEKIEARYSYDELSSSKKFKFDGADGVRVVLNSSTFYRYSNSTSYRSSAVTDLYGMGNVYYGVLANGNPIDVLGDSVVLDIATPEYEYGTYSVDLIPLYFEDGDYTVDTKVAPTSEDTLVPVKVSLASDRFTSSSELSTTVRLKVDTYRDNVIAMGKDIPHYVLNVYYNAEKHRSIRGMGETKSIEYNSRDLIKRLKRLNRCINTISMSGLVKPVDMSFWYIDCINVKDFPKLPESVEVLDYTYYGCESMNSLPIIPQSVKSLESIFIGCVGLPSVLELDLSNNDLIIFRSIFGGIRSEGSIIDNFEFKGYSQDTLNIEKIVIKLGSIRELGQIFGYNVKVANIDITAENADYVSSVFGNASNITARINNARSIYNFAQGGIGKNFTFISNGYIEDVDRLVTGVYDNIDISFNKVRRMSNLISNSTSVSNLPEVYRKANISISDWIFHSGNFRIAGDNTYSDEINLSIDLITAEYKSSYISMTGLFENDTNLKKASLKIDKVSDDIDYPYVNLSNLCAYSSVEEFTFDIPDDIPVSLTNAFHDCKNLKSVPELPKSLYDKNYPTSSCVNYMFDGCDGLTGTVDIDFKDAKVISNAFVNCNNIEKVNIKANNVISMVSTSGYVEKEDGSREYVYSYEESEDVVCCNAFSNCANLKEVSIEAKNTLSLSKLFRDCPSVEKVTLNTPKVKNLSYAFKDCNELKTVEGIPDEVTNMSHTFENCLLLSEIPTIPSNVRDLSYCFSGCDGFSSVDCTNDRVTNVEGMFYNCSNLKSAKLSFDNAESVKNLLDNCKTLESANISLNNTTSVDELFKNCVRIKEVSLSADKATSLKGLFKNCKSLETVSYLPSNATDMSECFYDCISLKSVVALPLTVKNLDKTFWNCTSLEELPEIPSGVESMNYTFYGCSSISDFPEIPNSVTSLNGTFMFCTSLLEIPEIPSSVESMNSTFEGDTGITVVNFSSTSVKSMDSCFSDCTSLSNVSIDTPNVEDIDDLLFGCSNIVDVAINTPKVRSAENLLAGCSSLVNADIDVSNASSIDGIISNSPELVSLKLYANSVTTIPTSLLNSSVNLSTVDLELNSCTSSLSNFFSKNSALTEVSLKANSASNVDSILSYKKNLVKADVEFLGAVHTNYILLGCTALNSAMIKLGSPEVAQGLCSGCSNLTDVNIKGNDIKDASSAFYNCAKLRNIDMDIKSIERANTMFGYCKSIIEIPNLPDSISDATSMFAECKGITNISGTFDGINNGRNLFLNCSNLTSVDFSSTDISNASSMFSGCNKLVTASVNIPNATDISTIFNGDTALKTISLLTTDKAENLKQAFYNCRGLTNISISANKATNVNNLFSGCSGLTTVDASLDSATDCSYLFNNCSKLTDIKLSAKSVVTASYMFSGCTALASVPSVDYSNASDVSYMFSGCSALTDVSINVSKADTTKGMFNNCKKLTKVYIDCSEASDISYMFQNCSIINDISIRNNKATNLNYTFAGTGISSLPELNYSNAMSTNQTFYNCKNLSNVNITANSTKSALSMFANCNNLKSASVSFNSATNIGNLFNGCTALDSISMNANSATDVTSAFYGCTSLEGVELQLPVVTNTSQLFRGCSKLADCVIDIPMVTNLSQTFSGCKLLTEVHFGEKNGVSMIPNSVTNMNSCFNGCTSLVNIPNIPSSVTDMNSCFYGCTSLVNIPASISNASKLLSMQSTFYGCTSLVGVPTLPDSVTSMNSCFYGCTSLVNIPNIPSSVTDINSCFNGCTSLESIPNTISNASKLTSMQSTFYNCTSLESMPELPNSITNMSNCFYGCTSLKNITNISNGVTNMGYCFYKCTSLESIPESLLNATKLTNLNNCFAYCENLQSVSNIPSAVTDMSYCFNKCTNLKHVGIIPSTVKTLSNTFVDCINLTGDLVINANPTSYSTCFKNTSTNETAHLYLSGDSTKLNVLFNTKSANSNIELK